MTTEEILRAFEALSPDEQAAVRRTLGAEAGTGKAEADLDPMKKM